MRDSGDSQDSLLGRIDRVCDQFENDCHNSSRLPNIEDYLADVSASERASLLAELLLVEFSVRRRRGESPTIDDLAKRYPEYARLNSIGNCDSDSNRILWPERHSSTSNSLQRWIVCIPIKSWGAID